MEIIEKNIGKGTIGAMWVTLLLLIITQLYIGLNQAETLALIEGILLFLALSISLFIVSGIFLRRYEDKIFLVLLFSLLHFFLPDSILAHSMFFVSLLLLWAHFCFVKNQFFTAFFLLGIATVFFSPIVWIALIVFCLLLLSLEEDRIRFVLKFLSGYLLPMLFGLAYLFINDRELSFFFEQFVDILQPSFPFESVKIIDAVIAIFLFLISIVALYAVMVQSNRSSREERYIFHNQQLYFCVVLAVAVLFSNKGMIPSYFLLPVPLSILLCRLSQLEGYRRFVAITFGILCMLFIVVSIGHFV